MKLREPIWEDQDDHWDPKKRCAVEKFTNFLIPAIRIDWIGPQPIYNTTEPVLLNAQQTANKERISAWMRKEIEEIHAKLSKSSN